jgi:hypothetical protein
MRKVIILFILTLSVWVVNAQDEGKVVKTIKGKVINEASNEPVSYTNIGLEGTLYGTASDGDGNFELKIPALMVSKNIFFSAVGFKNEMFPVTLLFGKEFNVVKLRPQSYDIGKIDVAAQSKVLTRILRMASDNTPYNFIGGPFNLICNYEKKTIVDDSVQMAQNAVVTVFDKNGYIKPSQLDAFQSLKYQLKEAKKTSADYRFSTGTNNLDDILGLDWVRTSSSVMNPGLLADFQLKLEGEPEVDGSACWLISFKQNNPTLSGSGDYYATSFEGKITIEKDDYSVKKIEGKIHSEKNNRQGRGLAIGASNANFQKDVSYDFTINYSNLKPDYILLNKTYTSNGKKVKEQSKLVVNQVQTTNLVQIDSREYFAGE